MARRIKSLKYEVELKGGGYLHREHRSKKGRKYFRDINPYYKIKNAKNYRKTRKLLETEED